jgi:hypothetical protein
MSEALASVFRIVTGSGNRITKNGEIYSQNKEAFEETLYVGYVCELLLLVVESG